MAGMGHYKSKTDLEYSALPAMKKPCLMAPPGWKCTRQAGHDGPCAAEPYDTPIAGPKITWNADGMHIKDPRADRREKKGSLPGCFTIPWDALDEMRKQHGPK
jgi:hypothetical protein